MGDLSGPVFDFERGGEKATVNIRRYSVSFEEASSISDDALMLTEAGWMHSDEEDRYISIGFPSQNRLLVVYRQPQPDDTQPFGFSRSEQTIYASDAVVLPPAVPNPVAVSVLLP